MHDFNDDNEGVPRLTRLVITYTSVSECSLDCKACFFVVFFILTVIDLNSYSAKGSVGANNLVFGGQVIGQALTTASKSIQDLDSAFLLHSAHCYFVSPTLYDQDILYKVHRIKEGKSFCTLTIEASQVSDEPKITFKCMVSFYKADPTNNALDFVTSHMPIVPHPDNPDAPIESDHRYLINIKDFIQKQTFPTVDIRICFTAKEIDDRQAGRPVDAK